ncbi:MAG: small subunit ribosomal protein [Patescibacteria group bacterium]|jgi:small subunit ribosomal protein S13|nr:small subunit ribosomal protein [Patescibacteria group bacterium]
MRISGITIPERRLEMALTVVYGVGRARARKILDEARVDYSKNPKDLTTDEENLIRKIIEDNYTIEGNLKRTVSANIKRLKDIGSYRGSRHSRGLPVRAQRTKTNSRTVRGNVRKTMGSGRVIASKT